MLNAVIADALNELIIEDETRVCQKCGNEKHVSCFYNHRFNRTCKPCWALRKNEWGSRPNRETGLTNKQASSAKTWKNYSNVHKRHRAKLRHTVLEHYSNATFACECCHEREYQFLAIDHVYPVGRKPKNGAPRSGPTLYRWLINNGFPDGYRVLCHNCNLGRSINGGVCPHEERYAVTA